jgi:hypothetical protein
MFQKNLWKISLSSFPYGQAVSHLGSYEASSGQLINKGKSALYLSKKISYARKLVIQNVSGIPEK